MDTDIKNRSPEGCKACRESIDGKYGPPLVKLVHSTSQDAILYRCEKCGICWLSTEGETKAIPEDDARLDFPEAFSNDRPGGDNYESGSA